VQLDQPFTGKEQEQVESELCHRFELVEPNKLASWLKDREIRETLLTVDVRGRDWVGGHIASSINLRTSEVVRHPESLILQCRRNKVDHIIFTCMYSVLRARKCAMAVQRAQEDEQAKSTGLSRIRISLLEGGMHAWMNHFARSARDPSSSTLIDGFDPECWCDGGPSQGGLVHVMDALWSSGGQKALSDALTQELESLLVKCKGSTGSSSASREVSRRGSHEAA
jgi:rhodanese-related sulfurtransferase